MNTLTLETLATLDASQLVPALAIEHAESMLRIESHISPDVDPTLVTVSEMIKHLGDKHINALAGSVRRFIAEGPEEVAAGDEIKYVVNDRAAVSFLGEYRGKDKLAERRATLLAWFTHERQSVDELHGQLAKLRAERVPAAGGKRKSSRAKRMLSTVSDKSTIENLAKEAAAAGDTAMAEQLARAAESGMMVVVATPNVIRAAGPGPARGGRAPSSDKYASMDLDALRAEVKSMFGIETGMKAVAHLRYRLRLGAKAIARGEKPVWNPASNYARIPLMTLRGVVNALSLTAHHFGTGPERTAVDGHIATLTEAIRKAEASASQDSTSGDSAQDDSASDDAQSDAA